SVRGGPERAGTYWGWSRPAGRCVERMPGRKRKARVTQPPRSPAATRVVRAPTTWAAQPASPKERGSSEIEMNQSRLDTRPRREAGTNRCLAVSHTIVPAVSRAWKARLTAISCQPAVASPYPATEKVAIAQQRYI